MEETTPSLRRAPVRAETFHCLRVRHHAAGCTACRDACPRQAVTLGPGPEFAAERCDGCGACVGICPTGALSLRATPLEAVLAEAEGRAVAFVCRHAAGGQGTQVPCLAFLDVGALLAVATRPATVTLEAGPCPDCPDRANLALAERAAAEANALLALYGEEGRVVWRRTRPYTTGESVSRRGLFGLVRRRAQAHLEVDPEEPQGPRAKGAASRGKLQPSRRALLLAGVQTLAAKGHPVAAASEPAPALPFSDLTLSEACDGCGMCLTFCPTGALRAERRGGTMAFAFTTDYCLGCGVCVAVCPRTALALRPLAERPDLGATRALLVQTARKCAQCGDEFPALGEATLCPQCAKRQSLEHAIRRTLFGAQEAERLTTGDIEGTAGS